MAMNSAIQPARSTAVPSLGRPAQPAAAVRRVLVIEEWVPEPTVVLHPPRTRSRAAWCRELSAPFSSALIGTAVIVLHASLAAWLWLSPQAPRLDHRPPEPLILLAEPAPTSVARVRLTMEPIILEQWPTLVPTLLTPVPLPQGQTEIAVAVAAPSDVLIGEASARDIDAIARACRVEHAAPARLTPPVTLLVRVETDGRVSDGKVEVGSGAEGADDAARRCLLAHGSLPPRRINGAAVPSWQRVHWRSG